MTDQDQDVSPIDAQLAAPPPSTESPQDYPEPVNYAPTTSNRDLLQNRGAVLALLFLVTGVLGLPLLWVNRQFSNTERVFWSVVVTIYTVALVAGAAWIVWWAYNRIVGV